MPNNLHIKIDGRCLSDKEAKIIALLIYGLLYPEIARLLGGSAKTIRNLVSDFYQTLDTTGLAALLRKAHAWGFDFNGYCYCTDLLSPFEREMLYKKFPHLNTEKMLPVLVF